MSSTVYTPAFFKGDLAESYRSARRIAPLVLGLVPARSVLDVGCGTGHFLKAFAEAGIADIQGIDGDYVPRDQLAVDPACFRAVDLAQPFDLGRQFDLVVSLEVAEHLPAAAADGFVAALVAHAPVALFSAAIPDQGGTGHLNEQWPRYWAERFAQHGFAAYDVLRPALWPDGEVAWWYRQNCLLFARAETAARLPALAGVAPTPPALLDRVHPDLYALRIRERDAADAEFKKLRGYLETGSLFAVERLPNGRITITRK